jgi:hypothetical protein
MHKKLVIAIKTLSWSKVSNTPKNTMLSSKQWYSKHSFLHAYQTPLKYIMVLKNTMILSQNFKNTLFPNTPLIVNKDPLALALDTSWQATQTNYMPPRAQDAYVDRPRHHLTRIMQPSIA